MNADMMAERVVRGYTTGGPMLIEMECRKVRQLLNEAKRELLQMLREVDNGDMKKVTTVALENLEGAREYVEKMIGIGMSVEMEKSQGFRSSERTATSIWVDLTGMRKTVDRMIEQVNVWIDREKETAELGESNFDYAPYYKTALTALRDCSEKLYHVERWV